MIENKSEEIKRSNNLWDVRRTCQNEGAGIHSGYTGRRGGYFLGRRKSERIRNGVDILKGYRNGHGKPRKFALMNGTVTVQRPRIRDCEGKWQLEYEEWNHWNLSDLELVYQWADGIYVKAGLEKEKAALLVIVEALSNGKKVLLACEGGYRESKELWLEVLRNLKKTRFKASSFDCSGWPPWDMVRLWWTSPGRAGATLLES